MSRKHRNVDSHPNVPGKKMMITTTKLRNFFKSSQNPKPVDPNTNQLKIRNKKHGKSQNLPSPTYLLDKHKQKLCENLQ